MKNIYQKKNYSIMTVINLSLATVIGLTLISIFGSIWVTDLSGHDAQSINLSGTLRMQTYKVSLDIQRRDIELAKEGIKTLDSTWNHSLFARLRPQTDDAEPLDSQDLQSVFMRAYQHWFRILRPALQIRLTDDRITLPLPLIEEQLRLTNRLVNNFQLSAEKKVRDLRIFGLLTLFLMIFVSSAIFYLLRHRIEKPLAQLTEFAHRIGRGDYGKQVKANTPDELGLMATVMNHMSHSIDSNHHLLENRVKERTQELENKNISLSFLFDMARHILDSDKDAWDFNALLNELAVKLKLQKIKLCLFTTAGERPYLQLVQEEQASINCSGNTCDQCQSDGPFVRQNGPLVDTKFPIVHHDKNYGIISVTTEANSPMPPWQEKLLASIANQLSLALSLSEQEAQTSRLAMLNERTVIARELHDSLAQALSYLQIQVTRLQKSHDKEKFDLQQPIINELREGLSTAYRQLRELLTTFRLKVDKEGLKPALEHTVEQLKERSEMDIQLHFHAADLPLTPTEEIHLLQIAREALQNCVHHSKGSRASITLESLDSQAIRLTVEDNGVGIPSAPEKLNHYGLAIMTERSRHLRGDLAINARPDGGTLIELSFVPEFARRQP